MYDTMVAAALTNATFVVLDRPNPITGLNAFGPVLNESYASYVGRRAIAQSHGMTTGELAKMFVGEKWIQESANGSELSLEVIQMKGWKRSMTWKDTGLPWVMPSPSTLSLPLLHRPRSLTRFYSQICRRRIQLWYIPEPVCSRAPVSPKGAERLVPLRQDIISSLISRSEERSMNAD